MARRERIGTAILGAGISGLSAAWTLARAGDTDFRVYDLEAAPGGTAASGENSVTRFPWGAHYVPVPVYPNHALEALLEEAGALVERDEDGDPVWAEEMLCREPEERLFFRGQWHEGLYPRAGASAKELDELARFEAAMRRLAARRDARGRRAFAVPVEASSGDAEFTVLDKISMRDWLHANGFGGERLLWLVAYGCRDDFGTSLEDTSAWAGIHYFAARLTGQGEEEDPAEFLSWPEGNGRLVDLLAKAASGRVVTNALVHDVLPLPSAGVEVRYLDAARDEVVRVTAAHAVFALPKFVAAHVVAPFRNAPPAALKEFTYAPWLVANLTLVDRPRETAFPLAWDNVIHDSPSLGYVVATHQSGRDRGPTVFTFYRAFQGENPAVARGRLLSSSWSDLAAAAVADLTRAHPDLPSLVTRVDVVRWGHAMARPVPGFLWGPARRAAGEPIGSLRFAHADVGGLPLFEDAQRAGVAAAEAILKERRTAFTSLLT